MNFTGLVKEDILSSVRENACCRVAFLSAYLHAVLSVVKNSEGFGFEIETESEDLAAFVQEELHSMFGKEADEIALKADKLRASARLILRFTGEGCADILKELGFLSAEEPARLLYEIPREIVENDCCKRAFVAGAFLGAGSATLPEKGAEHSSGTGYHLQFLFSGYEYASTFCELLAVCDFFPKLIERKNGFVVYFKNSQIISDFLAFIGAGRSVCALQERLVEKSFQNQVNRQVNCEMGNMTKQVNAYVAQKLAIGVIEETVGVDSLPEGLKEVCRARLAYPDASLELLAETLGITKSCLNHRLRKIAALSKTLAAK